MSMSVTPSEVAMLAAMDSVDIDTDTGVGLRRCKAAGNPQGYEQHR